MKILIVILIYGIAYFVGKYYISDTFLCGWISSAIAAAVEDIIQFLELKND